MRGFHFSLRWLFGIVSFLAVGSGLLIYAPPFLSKLTATLTALVLLAAVPAAIYHSGDLRAFWGGFAAFGLAYLWMVCGTWQSHDGSTALRDRLVTTDLLVRCHDALPLRQTPMALTPAGYAVPAYGNAVPPTMTPGGAPSPYQSMTPFAFVATTSTVDRSDFLTTGHSLFAIVFAVLGGAITRRCSSRARAVSSEQSIIPR